MPYLINRQRFWLSAITGAITVTLCFVILSYYDYFNIFTALTFIPLLTGFLTVSIINTTQYTYKYQQICTPWIGLLIIFIFPLYWKLRLLIILAFPMASLGGLIAGFLFNKFHHKKTR